jgi:glycosyltransferase involved in cell wall biosynthesis
MRIAIANSSRIFGGGEVMAVRLTRGLTRRGHRVVVLCRRDSPLQRRLSGEIPCEPTLGGFDANPVSVTRTAVALRRHRPDVLLTITQKDPRIAGVAARALGIPVLVRQGVDVPFLDRMHHRLFYGWLPERLVASSATAAGTMVDSVPWLTRDDVAVIENGVDVERIAGAAPKDLGLPADAIAIGYASRHDPLKGVLDLLAAWPRIAEAVPRAHLVLVRSGGRAQDQVHRLSTQLPRVSWVEFSEEIGPLMKALDLLVVPSHSEGFGLVAVEAMAAGVPVAAARVSNLGRLIRDGVDGRHFQVGDPDSLADVVIHLALNPEMRRAMAEAGHARAASDFSIERMLTQYEELLADVAAS